MDKISEIYRKIKSLQKDFIKFDDYSEEHNFKPVHHTNPTEEGFYVTIQCGSSGIYQMVNEWRYGEWQFGFLDDSITIAFNPNKVEL